MKDSLQKELKKIKNLKNEQSLDEIDINWIPFSDSAYQIEYVDIVMGITQPNVKKGDDLVWLWENVASIPRAEFSKEGIIAIDEAGDLNLKDEVRDGEMGFSVRYWKLDRNTIGNVALSYRFFPREVPSDYLYRPYYDFRNELFGSTGAGATTLVVPKEQMYHVHININWDLANMPPVTMYSVGKIKKHEIADGRFRFYWLHEPLPDKDRILKNIPAIIQGMADFFEDEETNYRLFFRKDPFKMSNGATAFENGFIYGYSDGEPLNFDVAMDIFSHEIVHTWPSLQHEDGNGPWFQEGTAEWYSIVIPYRLGITDLDTVAKQISWRGIEYYNNPYKEMSNVEAAKIAWNERRAQWLPYGRGFFYLMDVDLKLKTASGGRRCLDDLVLEMVRLKKSRNDHPFVNDWEKVIQRELGDEAVKDFRDICNGKIIEPNENWFNGYFEISRGIVNEPVRNTLEEGYLWTRKPEIKDRNL